MGRSLPVVEFSIRTACLLHDGGSRPRETGAEDLFPTRLRLYQPGSDFGRERQRLDARLAQDIAAAGMIPDLGTEHGNLGKVPSWRRSPCPRALESPPTAFGLRTANKDAGNARSRLRAREGPS
jgi:hypothetical protein